MLIYVFSGQSDMEQPSSYPVEMPYHGHGLAHSHPSNGHPDNSPASSHLSLAGEAPQAVRSQKQQTTQQVSRNFQKYQQIFLERRYTGTKSLLNLNSSVLRRKRPLLASVSAIVEALFIVPR